MNTVWLAFIAGLTTGGISCVAVQGGVLVSAVTQNNKSVGTKKRLRSIGLFLFSKLSAHVLLGALLGAIGASLQFSPKIMGAVQIVVGLFMFATAGRLLSLHPVFRYTVIRTPRFIQVFRNKRIQGEAFAPLVMGTLTIFMPCGVTQAMMVAALSSGSAFAGAMTMGAFVIGTSPVFFALGVAFIALLKKKLLTYVASFVVIVFGLLTLNGGLILIGSPYNYQNLYRAAVTPIGKTGTYAVIGTDGIQDVTIIVKNFGYESDSQILHAGVPVRLHLVTDNVNGCSRAFVIPDKNISKSLPSSGEEVLLFTPEKTGDLQYSCGMGMYSGTFEVR